jgi:hypothetical protein
MECAPNFELEPSGKCRWKQKELWYWTLAGVAFLWLWISADFFINCCTPDQNPEALYHGLLHRQAAKVRNSNVEEQPMFPLTVNVHRKQISGPGLTLFFNWFVLLFFVGSWLTLISGCFYLTGDGADRKVKAATLCDSIELRNINDTQSKLTINVDLVMCNSKWLMLWTGLAYIGVVLLTFGFYIYQNMLWQKMKYDHDSIPVLRRYTVEASGFPSDAIDSHELMIWWQRVADEVSRERAENVDSVMGVADAKFHKSLRCFQTTTVRDVVEVSVAYDYHDNLEEVTRLVDDHLDNEEDLHDDDALCVYGSAEQRQSRDMKASPRESKRMAIVRHTPWVQCFSFIMLGTDINFLGLKVRGYDPSPPEVSYERKDELLRDGLQGSGRMIVVFRTQELTQQLLEYYWQHGELPFTWHDSEIKIEKNPSEPTEVRWENFGVPPEKHFRRMVLAILLIPLIVILWAFLYYPWAQFSLNASVGANSFIATLTDQLLSVMIALGNCIVGYAAAFGAEWYGFRHTNSMRKCYLLVIVPGVALNVVTDVVVTWMVVYKDKVNLAFFQGDSGFFWSYGMDHIFESIFWLLIPAYVLVPYVLEPFFTVCVAFWLGVWRVKSDRSISKQHAERILMAPEIDIINPPYADMICTTSVFAWTLWSPNSRHWILFLAFTCWVALLYFQNRLRILRWQTRAHFGSPDPSNTQAYLWSVPVGVLAGTFGAHWSDCSTTWYRTAFGVGAFIVHIVGHCLVLHGINIWMAKTEVDEQEYADAIKRHPTPATYLNTNPVEVLKSRMDSANVSLRQPLIYYKCGKDYLQKPDSKLYFGRRYSPLCGENLALNLQEDVEEYEECLGEEESIWLSRTPSEDYEE